MKLSLLHEMSIGDVAAAESSGSSGKSKGRSLSYRQRNAGPGTQWDSQKGGYGKEGLSVAAVKTHPGSSNITPASCTPPKLSGR
jgi:hypothetical protein